MPFYKKTKRDSSPNTNPVAVSSVFTSTIGDAYWRVGGAPGSLIRTSGGTTNEANYSTIAGGKNSYLNSPYSFMGGGYGNIVRTSSSYAFIGTGKDNMISGTTSFSSILNGTGNTIYSSSADSVSNNVILAGKNNSISGVVIEFNTIINGIGNDIREAVGNSVVNGNYNVVEKNSEAFIHGSFNTITASNFGSSHSIFGRSNLISGSTSLSTFVTGGANFISRPFYSIIGGYTNYVTLPGQSIIHGSYNVVNTTTNSLIVGERLEAINIRNSLIAGHQSDIDNTYGVSTIGYRNTIRLTRYSTIQGRNNHSVYTNYATIGGKYNRISGGTENSILNGRNNIISGGTHNTILNGRLNYINPGVEYATIINGSGITATTSYTTYVDKLNIKSSGATGDMMLTWDSTTGDVGYQSIPSGGSGGTGTQTLITNGLNTYTGGTANNPSVNVSALTIASLTVSGNTVLKAMSASSITSGITNIENIFVTDGTHLGGHAIFTGKTGNLLNFRGITAGSNITLTPNASFIRIDASAPTGAYLWLQGDAGNSVVANNGSMASSNAASPYSIVAGQGNTIPLPSSEASGILAGKGNTIYNFTKYSFIGAGGSNYLNYSLMSSVVGGLQNRIQNNGPYVSDYSSIVGGTYNKVVNATFSNIVAGNYNNVSGNTQQITFANVVNGKRNDVTSNYSSILNGRNNGVQDFASWIGVGFYNRIDGNAITNAYGYNAIIAGLNNNIFRSKFNGITNGKNNYIGNASDYSSILGGSYHTINAAKHSAIIAGKNYTLTDDYTVMTPKLRIGNLPTNFGAYWLVADAAGNVYKTAYVSPSGEINTASNIGPGTGIFSSKVGVDLQFKGLSAGTGISLASNSNTILITNTASAGGGSSVDNGLNTYTAGTSTFQSVNISGASLNNLTVTGTTVLSGTSLNIGSTVITFQRPFTFANGTSTPHIANTALDAGISFVNGVSTMTGALSAQTISATTYYSGSTLLSSLLGQNNTASNLGSGTGIFAQKSGVDLQFKGLSAGTNITLANNANTIVINSTGGGGGATVNNGLNTYTAGTSTFQSVNVSALTINTLSASGTTNLTGSVYVSTATTTGILTSAYTMNHVTVDVATGQLFRRSGHTLHYSWDGSHVSGTGPGCIWTNMPAGKSTWLHATTATLTGDATYVGDFNGMTQARLWTSMQIAGAGATTYISVEYSTDNSAWNTLILLTVGNSTGAKDSGWVSIPFAMQTFCYIRLVGANGNGTADPRFSPPTLIFR